MSSSKKSCMIEAHYLGQTILLIQRGSHWTNWWLHQEFEFGDGKLYRSSDAALAAIQHIVQKVSAIKILSNLIDDWVDNGKISHYEMFRIKLSLMSFLP